MEVAKNIRIAKLSNELGVGVHTIVEYLKEKGFSDVAPNTKVSDEMYQLLAKEFQQDAILKDKSQKVEIGLSRVKEEIITSAISNNPKKEEEEEELQIVTQITPSPPEIVNEKVETKESETPQISNQKIEESDAQQPTQIDEGTNKLKGPTVVGKIDVSNIESKRSGKKKNIEENEPKEEQPIINEAVEESEVKPEATEEINPIPENNISENIPNLKPEEKVEAEFIERKKVTLEGTKIMGKIELKVHEPKKAVVKEEDKKDSQHKRQRKRIPVNKKNESSNLPPTAKPAFTPNRNFDKKKTDYKPKENEPPKEITEKEIQEKIKETQARLAGLTSKAKGSKAKFKRQKRESQAEIESQAHDSVNSNLIEVTEFISVSELASMMDVSYAQIISKCMELGVMVSINQRLDAEIIELVASEFEYKVKFVSVEDKDDDLKIEEDDDPALLKDRPPVVTVMGHVDHGKTTLLDFIRKAKVAEGEAGGITQHIGAYEVTSEAGKKVVFLDTPGHEAFTAMRARGAKITDVAVIVIAADDSVMPQTKEAISHAQAANVPMVFAINKIDKEGANPEKIREQLAQMNLLVEEWGGKYQCQEISAKQGLNIEKLVEKILLEAEMLELKANPDKLASGTVIEATLDKGRGYVTTVLVQNGTIKHGDIVLAGTSIGRIKALYSSVNEKINTSGPASACIILGLDGAPQAGEKFHVMKSESDAKEIINKRKQIIREQGLRTKKHITLDEIGRRLALGNFKELNLLIKGDVDGSVEALTDALLKLSSDEVQVKIVHRAVGQITESDVLLASASDAIICGFNVRPSSNARKLAENENIEIKYYSIIYNAIEEIKTAIEGLLEPTIEEKINGYLEVKEVYKIPKIGAIAGCQVTEGKIYRNSKARLIRDGIVMYTGELASLKRFKDDVKDVVSGQECGCSLKNYSEILAGDSIECYEEKEIKRKL